MLFYILLTLTAVAHAAPETFVKWMELKGAMPVEQSKTSNDAILSYKPYESAWTSFKEIHGKKYESEEQELHRFKIFLANIAYIESHNEQYINGQKSFYLGVNHFTDLEFEEFRQLNGFRGANMTVRRGSTFLGASFVTLPDSVDWRDHGYVTPVKNQGRCGSCWSFSATGSLEGQHFKSSGKLVSLSEQQLVDCSAVYGNHGCNGGLMDNAFQYVEHIGGIDSETSYPYEAVQETKCHFHKQTVAATCTGFTDVSQGSEDQLKEATATIGPISIAIDASHRSFQLYKAGVYDEPQCSPTQLDHGVLIVGYGTSDSGLDFWIVKNSWGPKWGEQGYIMMSRNKDNQCGVASKASFPLV